MRRKIFWGSGIGAKSVKPRRRTLSIAGRFENLLIKGMIICTVFLALFQMQSITNPVDFYLKIAGDIDTPAFNYDEYANEGTMDTGQNAKVIKIYFQAEPVSSVLVVQNGKTLGEVGSGISLYVQPGTVDLDATHLAYPVKVRMILNQKNYEVELNGNKKSIYIQLKSGSAS